jgi:hypothetical protein
LGLTAALTILAWFSLSSSIRAQPSPSAGDRAVGSAATAPDAERLALARRLSAVTTPTMLRHVAIDVEDAILGDKVESHESGFYNAGTDQLPPPPPRLRSDRMRASLRRGAAQIGHQLAEARARFYARTYTAAELSAVLAFVTLPAERDIIERRMRVQEYVLEGFWPENIQRVDEKKARVLAQEVGSVFQSTPEEKAFVISPVGRVAWTSADALLRATEAALTELWPSAITVAEADYCRRGDCSQRDHEFIAKNGRLPPPSPGMAMGIW